MKKLLCLAVVLSIAAVIPASAQSFGELFPLANTRYDAARGTPRLTANDRDFFLFWSTERKTWAASLAQRDPQVGHVVLDTTSPFDVAWTGTVFVAASSRSIRESSNDANLVGRVLDAQAQPLGEEFLIAEHGREPRIAAGAEAMVIVYRGTGDDTRVLVRGTHGEDIGAESFKVAQGGTGYAVASNGDGFVVAVATATETRTIGLDRHGRVVSEDSLPYTLLAVSYRELALATDGQRYLLAWCTRTAGGKGAVLLDQDGSFGTELIFGGGFSSSLSAVWTGAGWRVSWGSKQGDATLRTRVALLDRDVTTRISEEKSAAGGVINPSMAAIHERVMVAWSKVGEPAGASSVIELPLATNQPRVATYAAKQQTLLATASSADATLMIWTEHDELATSIHAGVRTNDGQWTERELDTDGFPATAATAASDGNRFVVIVSGQGVQKLLRLDGEGRLVNGRTFLPGLQAVIAWNGTRYAIITQGPDLEGRLLAPTGELSAPVKLENSFSGKLSLASNGDGFLLAGETACQFIVCSRAIKGMRLGADLQRLEAEEIMLDNVYELAGTVWNGSEYVVTWRGASDRIFTARVPAAAASPIQTASTDADLLPRSVASMPDGSIAIAGPARTSTATRVAFLRHDGSLARSFDIDSATITGTPLLTRIPGGVAYVASSIQDAAPHHGTSHVMMAIAKSAVPPPPNPPHVVARLQNGEVLVDWSAASGTLNGYRLEYRVDGGSWIELEEWFGPSSNHRTIQPAFGTEFEIRMRAFNDGGVSAYATTTASTKPVRRRAAR